MRKRQIIAACSLLVFLFLAGGPAKCQTASLEDSQRALLGAVQLARNGKYAESADELEKYVRVKPENLSARCLLALADYRAQRIEQAVTEFKSIQRLPSSHDADNCLAKIGPMIGPELNRELEKSLDSRLAEFKSEQAMSVVDAMYLEPHQKELLKYSIELWRGNLARALSRLGAIHRLDPELSIEPLQKKVAEELAFFSKVKERLDWYRYSAITNGSCTPEQLAREERDQNYSLAQYAGLVAAAQEHFPLNSWMLDQAFFATLLLRSYEDTESLGDKILEAKGNLHLPFYARDSLYDLLIDIHNRKLGTMLDPRVPNNEAGDSRMLELVPFDVAFDRLTSLSQRSPADLLTGGLAKQSYALKIEPTGVAPYYAFMDAIHCIGGEAAQKRITANLGQFLLHVVGNSKISTHLANPESKTHDWLSATTSALAIGTIAASQLTSTQSNSRARIESETTSANALKILEDNQKESAIRKGILSAQEEQNKKLHDQVSEIIFSKLSAERVTALEKFEHELLVTIEASLPQ